jgi:hypothetical protein
MKFSNPTFLLVFYTYCYIIPQYEYLRWNQYVNINIDFLFFGIRLRISGLKNIDRKDECPF